MTLLQTIIIAIVEGLTEFLPVSSTGHMLIAENLLGVENSDFVRAFTIIIQFGAILSVVVLYWNRFFRLDHSPARKGSTGLQRFIHKWYFYYVLLMAFIPTAVLGLILKKSGLIDFLLNPSNAIWVVPVTLILGGVFMLFCDRIFNKGLESNEVNGRRAFWIGVIQCISMIPGVSRSMATIVGGMSQRLTRRKAAEFSFFLAVPTMAAATGLDLIELFMADGGSSANWATQENVILLIVGCVIAFVVALLAMRWFVDFLSKYGFKAFGWYRIVVGAVILALLFSGHDLVLMG
ncbi:MAG: undecaprenyl-diphosphate phosphatase [Prevotella sp.]|jgi:undecaprenyl-diphosphatase